jgi:hypothetical protein
MLINAKVFFKSALLSGVPLPVFVVICIAFRLNHVFY